MTDLAAIVARDARDWPVISAIDTSRKNYDSRIVAEALLRVSTDRRALLALLRPIGNWFATTHGNELGHDHHCRGAEPCTCGWAEAAPALDAISFLDAEPAALDTEVPA